MSHEFSIVNKVQYNLNTISIIFEQQRAILFHSPYPDTSPSDPPAILYV